MGSSGPTPRISNCVRTRRDEAEDADVWLFRCSSSICYLRVTKLFGELDQHLHNGRRQLHLAATLLTSSRLRSAIGHDIGPW